MGAPEFLKEMKSASDTMPPTARMRLVLDELLKMVKDDNISFLETPGSANTVGLYKAGLLWGVNVTFKANDLPSFIHELTHARCILCYQAETVNYAPGGINGVAEAFMPGGPPGAPTGTVCLTTQSQTDRRNAWKRPHCKVFLDTNLNNLKVWAEAADYSVPDPFMSVKEKKEMKDQTKAMNKGNMQAMTKVGELELQAKLLGQVQKSNKWKGSKGINDDRIEAEKTRKSNWIVERITYGMNGMSGMGDTHNEYDTVVNQMMFQMFKWGFRLSRDRLLTQGELAQHFKDKSIPADYLYDRISKLAEEAHLRRMNAGGIIGGKAPTIMAPATII